MPVFKPGKLLKEKVARNLGDPNKPDDQAPGI
jgi:hypothetical protein